jgi:hypothetical protein
MDKAAAVDVSQTTGYFQYLTLRWLDNGKQ